MRPWPATINFFSFIVVVFGVQKSNYSVRQSALYHHQYWHWLNSATIRLSADYHAIVIGQLKSQEIAFL
jgi:hypothetical protein